MRRIGWFLAVGLQLALSAAAAGQSSDTGRQSTVSLQASPPLVIRSTLLPGVVRLGERLIVPPVQPVVHPENIGRSVMIIDGRKAGAEEFPWMAFLTLDGSNDIRCSGALIGDRWVLTAAHCLPLVELNSDVWVGFTNSNGAAASGEKRDVLDVHSYGVPEQHDVGLIELATPSTVLPVALSANATGVQQPVTVVGFGIDQDGVSGVLNKATASTVDAGHCDGIPDASNTLCVADTVGGICFGDSGGPLLAQADGGYRVIGIAHALHPNTQCGVNGAGLRVGSFTPIAPYAEWIQTVIGSGR